MYTFIEKGVSIVYDTREDLVYLEIGTHELDKAHSCDYTKQELVDILRRLVFLFTGKVNWGDLNGTEN